MTGDGGKWKSSTFTSSDNESNDKDIATKPMPAANEYAAIAAALVGVLAISASTGNNSGITIGDNGTPQVVVVSGKDMPESTADMTLAHELTHALRGEEGIRSINTTG